MARVTKYLSHKASSALKAYALERRKIKQNTSDFFLRQSEDLIPPKMKRSDRCDTIFDAAKQNSKFLFPGNVLSSGRAPGIY